tara:strand:- start:36 stop:542 length:507 start_codon:yes stop_codon:yes gene_type:complete
MINWQYFPKSDKSPQIADAVVQAFEEASVRIDSSKYSLKSDEVLKEVRERLQSSGFVVETGKKKGQKIHVPVLFGLNGKLEKSFEADAYHREKEFVLEVEAGRAYLNNQFLKDLFQACMMHGVNHLGIAVRNKYKTSQDFDRIVKFIDTLYASSRIRLPLHGILIIGY